MLSLNRILVTTIALGLSTAGVTGCGQTGGLYLPTEPSAAMRATLPETLLRTLSIRPVQPTLPVEPPHPAAPASSPVPQ